MKSKVTFAKEDSRKPFPKTMISTTPESKGLVVAFRSAGVGFVLVQATGDDHSLFYSGTCWIMDRFEDFEGTIEFKFD
jgi:hypothetical protein